MITVGSCRRLGLVKVSRELLWTNSPKVIRSFFAQFVVLGIEYNFSADVLDFVMYHPRFKPVTRGDKLPYYVAVYDSKIKKWTVE